MRPFSYRPHHLPPGWTTHDLVQQPRRYDDQPLPDLTIEQAWQAHRERTDPPGYLVRRVGVDHGRPLFVATWAGANVDGSTTPKDRAGCRADMWSDFYANERAALLDQLTRAPIDEAA